MKPDNREGRSFPNWPEGMVPARPQWRGYMKWEPQDPLGKVGEQLLLQRLSNEPTPQAIGRARFWERVRDVALYVGAGCSLVGVVLSADAYLGTNIIRDMTENRINMGHGFAAVVGAIASGYIAAEAHDSAQVLRKKRKVQPSLLFEEITFD